MAPLSGAPKGGDDGKPEIVRDEGTTPGIIRKMPTRNIAAAAAIVLALTACGPSAKEKEAAEAEAAQKAREQERKRELQIRNGKIQQLRTELDRDLQQIVADPDEGLDESSRLLKGYRTAMDARQYDVAERYIREFDSPNTRSAGYYEIAMQILDDQVDFETDRSRDAEPRTRDAGDGITFTEGELPTDLEPYIQKIEVEAKRDFTTARSLARRGLNELAEYYLPKLDMDDRDIVRSDLVRAHVDRKEFSQALLKAQQIEDPSKRSDELRYVSRVMVIYGESEPDVGPKLAPDTTDTTGTDAQ